MNTAGMARERTEQHWPEPEAEQLRVMLLGTYHMDTPELDVVNIDADDVLSPDRQLELEDLADRLEAWRPDLVAVERPHDRQAQLNELYESYASGQIRYQEEVEIDPIHPHREDPVSECRSEVVQIGYRLADRLDLEQIHAVDYSLPMTAAFDEEELDEGEIDRKHQRARSRIDVDLPGLAEQEERLEDHLRKSTVTEHLRLLNREANLRFNHESMFAGALAGVDTRYVGARLLATWYERNLRILENLWRAADTDTERIFLVIGDGHVRILRDLLDEAPMCCPVSALPVLRGEGA